MHVGGGGGGDLGFPFQKYEIAISGQNSNYCTFYF